MRETRIAVAVTAVSTVVLAACAPAARPGIDMRPVGSGLEFLGMALVLAALIIVFGRLFR